MAKEEFWFSLTIQRFAFKVEEDWFLNNTLTSFLKKDLCIWERERAHKWVPMSGGRGREGGRGTSTLCPECRAPQRAQSQDPEDHDPTHNQELGCSTDWATLATRAVIYFWCPISCTWNSGINSSTYQNLGYYFFSHFEISNLTK